jgi:hypothetical protein
MTRLASPGRRRRAGLALALLVLALTLPLGACGKKAAPSAPPGETDNFPRHYPTQ